MLTLFLNCLRVDFDGGVIVLERDNTLIMAYDPHSLLQQKLGKRGF